MFYQESGKKQEKLHRLCGWIQVKVIEAEVPPDYIQVTGPCTHRTALRLCRRAVEAGKVACAVHGSGVYISLIIYFYYIICIIYMINTRFLLNILHKHVNV